MIGILWAEPSRRKPGTPIRYRTIVNGAQVGGIRTMMFYGDADKLRDALNEHERDLRNQEDAEMYGYDFDFFG